MSSAKYAREKRSRHDSDLDDDDSDSDESYEVGARPEVDAFADVELTTDEDNVVKQFVKDKIRYDEANENLKEKRERVRAEKDETFDSIKQMVYALVEKDDSSIGCWVIRNHIKEATVYLRLMRKPLVKIDTNKVVTSLASISEETILDFCTKFVNDSKTKSRSKAKAKQIEPLDLFIEALMDFLAERFRVFKTSVQFTTHLPEGVGAEDLPKTPKEMQALCTTYFDLCESMTSDFEREIVEVQELKESLDESQKAAQVVFDQKRILNKEVETKTKGSLLIENKEKKDKKAVLNIKSSKLLLHKVFEPFKDDITRIDDIVKLMRHRRMEIVKICHEEFTRFTSSKVMGISLVTNKSGHKAELGEKIMRNIQSIAAAASDASS